MRALVLDAKNTYARKAVSFASLPDLLDRYDQHAAGAADIPMTRFMGMSPGGLNSAGESDLRNYYDRIAAGQTLEMGPALTRLDEALIRSATGTRDPAMLNTTKAFASSVSHLPVTLSGGRSQVFAPNTGGFTIGTLFSADEAEKLRNLVSPPNGAEPPACSCGELRAELAAARGSQPAPEA